MTSTTLTRHVPAAPDAAFATISDIHRLPDWNRAIIRVIEAPERLEPGAEWVVEMFALAQHWPSRARVEVLDPEQRRFTYRSRTYDGNPSYATWAWSVDEVPGGSRVTVTWTLNPQTFWRRALLVRIRHHQLMKTEVPASLVAVGTIVRAAPHG